jgi:dephospho-CoA kinase
MNILITGNAGSGKTSVSEVLEQRGYIVHDADEGFGHWIHKKSGEMRSSRPTANRGDYYWVWRIGKIKSLLRETGDKTVFFCGVSSNQAELYKDFDKVMVLDCNLEIIKHRLRNRQNNPFGKRTGDIELVSKNHDLLRSQLGKAGAIEINADQPLDEVVDEILSHTDET